MNVFIFGTGRCGTVSAEAAFSFAGNYTTAHESLCSLHHYPDNHIEVNPQLRMVMPYLLIQHPDALYIWLKRDRQRVIESYERLDRGNWLNHWWVMNNSVKPNRRIKQAEIAVDYMLMQCEKAFNLVPKAQRLEVDIKDYADWFPQVWDRIEAAGNIQQGLNVFKHPRNTSKQRGDV